MSRGVAGMICVSIKSIQWAQGLDEIPPLLKNWTLRTDTIHELGLQVMTSLEQTTHGSVGIDRIDFPIFGDELEQEVKKVQGSGGVFELKIRVLLYRTR